MTLNFIHLRVHTEFSLTDGILTIPEVMEKAAAYKMPALGISDKSNLYATVKFYTAAIAAGIKPIIGTDLYIETEGQEPTRLTLFCQTEDGYRNLLKIISLTFLQGQSQYNLPTAKREWLANHNAGLIAVSGGRAGDLAIGMQDFAQAKARLEYWVGLFPNRFYVEISRVGQPDEAAFEACLMKLISEVPVPIIATNEVCFLERDDFEAHEARVCIQEGSILTDPQRKRRYTEQQYFRSPTEMQKLFADLPAALTNTVELAKRCNVTFALGISKLPHFPVPDGESAESYLNHLSRDGLTARLQKQFADDAEKLEANREQYEQRLTRELGVINEMGFAGYFLVVADFIQWANENGIPVGPGRGSGPGSLVAYALKITNLDPLAFDLLFERFLNPERVSMPDFDIDFCMEGRDRVIEYVMQKHGADSVSHIITYGTMAAKAVVRDVGRVLALGYGFVDKIAKLIPFELGITLEKALAQEPLLRERYDQEDDVKTLIDLALKLEGITRNVGKHAGGIVIAPGKLTDFVPLYCEANDTAHPVTQFDKDDVEAVGLVKFDFLGLKTLTIIDRALQVINHPAFLKSATPVDINLITLQDEPTFKLLKACQTTAVFQVESHGMRDLIMRLQPDCFEDLIALVALFRPGPLQSGMVDDFINRKQGRAKVIYPHPELEPILRPTYGVILYQEQVMQIAQVLAGYTLGAADILRRAMGKKKPEEMAKQREIFCSGAVARGVPFEKATSIFDLMEKFAGYGFNKSHSAAYALIAYQTAWLKTHYTAAFMAAVLTSEIDRTEKLIILLEECRCLKLTVSPPNVNESEFYFRVLDDNHIRYGLGAIKGVGQAAIENMIAVRKSGGAFRDLFDFCQRIDLRKANRRVLEALIKSGCFDCFNIHRASLMASLNNALQMAEQALHNATYGQQDLLGDVVSTAVTYVATPHWPEEILLQCEKDSLGYFLSGHPINKFSDELKHLTTCRIANLDSREHKEARIAGIISAIRTRQTKRGDKIAIFTLDDGTSQIEVVCFVECYQKYRSFIVADQVIIAEGEISVDEFNNHPRMVARSLCTIELARLQQCKSVCVHLKENITLEPQALKVLLNNYLGGKSPVIVRFRDHAIQADIKLGARWCVQPKDALLTELRNESAIETVEVMFK